MDALFSIIDERIAKGIKSAPFIQNEICVVEGLTENGLVRVKVLSTNLHITVPNWSGSPVEVGENVQLFYKGNVLSEQTAYIGASTNKSEDVTCTVHTYNSITLPSKVVLSNNNEYRYLSLTGANSITISIESIDTSKSFYSAVALHKVSKNGTLSSFVSVSADSVISNVVFLNDISLTNADTVEMLFFANGMSDTVCCIAYAYHT